MASASTYDGLLLKDDLREWAKVPGVEAVSYTHLHYCH